MQWTAVAVGAVAAVYLAVAGGISARRASALATSFGLYGLLKRSGWGEPATVAHAVRRDRRPGPRRGSHPAVVARRDATYGVGTRHTVLLTSPGSSRHSAVAVRRRSKRVPLVTIGLDPVRDAGGPVVIRVACWRARERGPLGGFQDRLARPGLPTADSLWSRLARPRSQLPIRVGGVVPSDARNWRPRRTGSTSGP